MHNYMKLIVVNYDFSNGCNMDLRGFPDMYARGLWGVNIWQIANAHVTSVM